MFRTGFGGPGFGFQQQQAPREAGGQGRNGSSTTATNPLTQILHLLPILILLFITFFNSASDPVSHEVLLAPHDPTSWQSGLRV